MSELYTITDQVPLPEDQAEQKNNIIKLLFALKPGESFLCKHYASGSIALIKRSNPERAYTTRRDKPTGMVRIWRSR